MLAVFHEKIIYAIDKTGLIIIDSFHDFNEDDEHDLLLILNRYNLQPISAGKFFSIRYALTADDMGSFSMTFTCETADFTKCSKSIVNDNGRETTMTVKDIEPEQARTIYDKFLALDIFNLKSIETQPLGVYLDIYHRAYLTAISVEVSDKKRLNRFSIVPGKHNDDRYNEIFKIFKNHGFLPEETKKNTSNESIDAKAIEKIHTFYKSYIFGNESANDSVIEQYCTKSLAQKLRKDYDNEYSDGGGYAVWEFRSNAQDGEDFHEIEKIEPLGERKYLVHYNDMGNKGSHTITVVVQGDAILFDKLD